MAPVSRFSEFARRPSVAILTPGCRLWVDGPSRLEKTRVLSLCVVRANVPPPQRDVICRQRRFVRDACA
jgi:hypothetical protein